MQPLCLDHLTLVDQPALEVVRIAAELGCTRVSLYVTPLPICPALDLTRDRAARAEVLAALRDSGLGVGVVEPFMLDAAPDWELIRRSADLAAELGGMINGLGFDEERGRLQDSVGRLAEIAAEVGCPVTLEPFPLSQIRTLAEGLAFARGAGEGVGLCVDALHVIRGGGNWADVAALPPEVIRHVQLCDGPRQAPEDRGAEAIGARLPPGTGEFDLPALAPHLPASAVIAVEAPFPAPELSPLERARVGVEATRRLFAA